MGILDVTEEQIFKTLGKGRDPNYKPVKVTDRKIKVEPFDFTRLLQ